MRKLNYCGELLLIAATLMAVAAPTTSAQANTQPAPGPPKMADRSTEPIAFAVAAIKPNKSGNNNPILRPLLDGVRARDVTALDLIRVAYGLSDFEDNRISGAPDWASAAKFDLDAKADGPETENLRRLSPDKRVDKLNRMLQTLLADRFKLAFHRETKELPAYELVISKNGPRLQNAKTHDPEFPNGTLRTTRGHIRGQEVSMVRLAFALGLPLHRSVLDRTGLTGKYDFSLEWEPDEAQGPTLTEPSGGQQVPPASPEADGDLIAVAIQQQLGLKLQPMKVRVEVFVIDHVEKPSEN